MAVMAPVSGLPLAVLVRLSAELPLPEAAAAPDKQSRVPDVVVFSSAPMRVLSDLASAGLRQLAALLPMIEQAVQEDSAAALGHLAKAAGAAARQIGEGHPALIAEGPDRVAAALRGPDLPQSDSPASALLDTKQVLRTLARQIGAEPEPAQEGRMAEVPDRFSTPLAKSALPQTSSPSGAQTDTKQAIRTLARQIGADAEPAQSGQPSEILRSIARQIGTVDNPEPLSRAEPGAGPIQRWLSEAKHVLRSTGDALDQAEQQLRPLAAAEPLAQVGEPPVGWALAQIVGAQAQIAMAYAALGQARTTARLSSRVAPPSFPIDQLAGATTFLGMLVILAALWFVGGLWSVATGLAGLAGTAAWVWRINRASRHVRLDAHG